MTGRNIVNSRRLLWAALATILLVVFAIFFRLPDLGVLGFYGDEETTAFPAKSVAEGNGLRMPSGLSYYRAIPLTILNSASAAIIGVDEELSYRLPAAILGILTPVALFFLSRGLVPTFLAFAAATLLVFSEWHIITSREARMYAPFMLCFLSTGLLFFRWADSFTLKRLFAIACLAALTLLLHTLGLLIVLFPLSWIALRTNEDLKWGYILGFIGFVTIFYLTVNQLIILNAYSDWIAAVGQPQTTTSTVAGTDVSSFPGVTSFPWNTLGIVGLLFGIWLGRCAVSSSSDNPHWIASLAVVFLSGFFGALLLSTNFYAAGITAAALFLLLPDVSARFWLRCRWPMIFLLVAGIGVAAYVLATAETMSEVKDHFRFPFPYFVYFWQYSPGLTILFWLGAAWSVCSKQRLCEKNVRLFSLVAIGIVSGLGVASQWGGMRYLIGAYPFILLVACYPLLRLQTFLARYNTVGKFSGITILAVVVFGGIVAGHSLSSGLAAKNLYYGDSNRPLTLGFEIYPDHQSAGQYVKRHADVNDKIIVEDVLQQYWYVGRELLWLRDEVSNSDFMYVDSMGDLRDIYVSSKVLTSNNMHNICSGRGEFAWLVTSAETESQRDLYLSDVQRDWLESVRRDFNAVFTGRDKSTAVYRIPCGRLN